KTCENLADTY
nr:RecName: Full=Defensin-like protein; AltName: Full=Sesquin [Vigna unguiculata subsp. sesquipedalis]